jgi:replication-associated recombination protein RarA
MKFLHHLFNSNKPTGFDKIEGYKDIKDIVIRALDAEENYNLLFIGPPASSKTLFLMGIQEITKDAVYFDCSNATSRILDVLQEERPKIILADEIDKLQKSYQHMLLNFMESGRVKVDQQKKQYDFVIKGAKIFATANDLSRLSKPLQSRFRKLFLPKYTEKQFISVAVKVLPRINENLARYIGATVFKNGGDVRDVLSIGKLVRKSDGPLEIEQIISTMIKYGNERALN